jgi:hypothetical protein
VDETPTTLTTVPAAEESAAKGSFASASKPSIANP